MLTEMDATATMRTDTDGTAPDIELLLPARAENIAIVRHAFGAIADAYPVSDQTLSDIKLAVTEACTNVVVHAYPDREDGPLEVQATVAEKELMIVVRDEGKGIAPRPDSPGLGLGLPLIASLADSVKLGHDSSGMTEVRMGFSLREGEASPS
jgi:anti-sigma regulatory factor (Ser/Thr protein kinase)